MIGAALLSLSAAQACGLPPGWAEVEARRTKYVIFGETHGTAEEPAFVGRLACALARRRERLLVAIEQSATDNIDFQKAWATPDRTFKAALARASGWKGRSDGVASEAMSALIIALHRLRASGRTIDVVLFNGTSDDAQRARFAALPGQGPHEAAQAENIRLAAAAKPYDHVLVLTGSLHARKDLIEAGTLAYPPMTVQLAPTAETTSLRMVSGAGTMWNCLLKPGFTFVPGQPISNAAIDCGAHATKAFADLKGPAFIRLGSPPGVGPGELYDGFVWVGPVTGSPPAVP